MSDRYAIEMLRVSLAQILQNVGFQNGTNISMNVLLDIYRRYLESMGRTMRIYCDQAARTELVLEDVEMTFREMRIPLRELADYVSQVGPVPFKHKIPLFPVQRASKLRIPSTSAEELRTRPDYIPAYLPLMNSVEAEPEPTTSAIADQSNVQPPAPSISIDRNKDDDDQEPSTSMMMGDPQDELAKLGSSTRISIHRSTISGKQDLSQCGDLIGDFSDFDAVKAGLIKFVVRPPTPPPPRLPTPPAEQSTSIATIASSSILKSRAPFGMRSTIKRKHPTSSGVYDLGRPKISLSFPAISSGMPHPKLKINLPSYKKRIMPIVLHKNKEKKKFVKIVTPVDPSSTIDGASSSSLPVVPKRRGRPPGSIGRPKKLALEAAARAAASSTTTTTVASTTIDDGAATEKEKPLDLSIVGAPVSSATIRDDEELTSTTIIGGDDSSLLLDVSTASVEDLVTSVIEETRSTIKAKEKASEHFVDSVLSVISSSATQQNETCDSQNIVDDSSTSQPIVPPLIINVGPSISSAAIMDDVEEGEWIDEEKEEQPPTISDHRSSSTSKSDQLKTILQRTRLVVNKDVIKQRLKEKKERNEAEAKKIRDVVEKSYAPIVAKRTQDDGGTQSTIGLDRSNANGAGAIVVVDPSSKQAPRRPPPGIPPTSTKMGSSPTVSSTIVNTTPTRAKPIVVKKPAPIIDYPPLFQPEHIKKTIVAVPPPPEQRKVAPLVISKQAKPSASTPIETTPAVGATTANHESKKEASTTKLIIKLASSTNHQQKEEESKKRKHHHHHEKDRHHHHSTKKEKHRDKEKSTTIGVPTVKKEKKDVAPPTIKMMDLSSIKTEPSIGSKNSIVAPVPIGPTPPTTIAAAAPKLKIKIDMKSKTVSTTSSSSPEKSKKNKPSTSTIDQHPRSSTAANDFEGASTSIISSPPPKSPSAYSNAPSIGGGGGAGGGGGYESPPPRTPSPGGDSCPPSPIYVNTNGDGGGEEKSKPTISTSNKLDDERRFGGPPAKKQKLDTMGAGAQSRPSSTTGQQQMQQPPIRNVTIKIDKSQFGASSLKIAPVIVPNPAKKQQQQQKTGGGKSAKGGGGGNDWICPACSVPYEDGANMIACDECDRWYHWSCVGLVQEPPEEQKWFCQQCQARKLKPSVSSPSKQQQQQKGTNQFKRKYK